MSINGTLAFVILWIVNALIALVYLLVGIFLYVPGTGTVSASCTADGTVRICMCGSAVPRWI